MLKYICEKKMYIMIYEKCKYAPKNIEMIFNIYKICNIY